MNVVTPAQVRASVFGSQERQLPTVITLLATVTVRRSGAAAH
jgi:hypothetical protein